MGAGYQLVFLPGSQHWRSGDRHRLGLGRIGARAFPGCLSQGERFQGLPVVAPGPLRSLTNVSLQVARPISLRRQAQIC
jgi:hypothetical protein